MSNELVNGQLLIGRASDNLWVPGVITKGPGVKVLNGPGGIQIGSEINTVEVNLCSIPKKSGSFIIPGTGLVTGKAVFINQASGPYTGKGTLADEAEMDGLIVKGKVISATEIKCFWNSATFVIGNFKFDYFISF